MWRVDGEIRDKECVCVWVEMGGGSFWQRERERGYLRGAAVVC